MRDGWRRRLDLPAYTLKEAAELAGIAPQTVAGWFYGYPHSTGTRAVPVFPEGKERRSQLSYLQLVEVAFIATCRSRGMSLKQLRTAREYLRTRLNTDHPFADSRLVVEGPHILAQAPGSDVLIAADLHGQVVWREFMAERFAQFEYSEGLALRWHPRGRNEPIIVDPRLNFGAPTVEGTGIATESIRDAARAGESDAEIAEDFGIKSSQVRAALNFEAFSRQAA